MRLGWNINMNIGTLIREGLEIYTQFLTKLANIPGVDKKEEATLASMELNAWIRDLSKRDRERLSDMLLALAYINTSLKSQLDFLQRHAESN